jgi:hypothetical protein
MKELIYNSVMKSFIKTSFPIIYAQPIIATFLLLLMSCTRETKSYETRLEIQNNLDDQINCVIYPKSGVHLSCDTNSYISQAGGFIVIYGQGESMSPLELFASKIDSFHIVYITRPDSSRKLLYFKPIPHQVRNYKNNPFADSRSWTIISTIVNHLTPTVNLHLETCIFEINRDSIINYSK